MTDKREREREPLESGSGFALITLPLLTGGNSTEVAAGDLIRAAAYKKPPLFSGLIVVVYGKRGVEQWSCYSRVRGPSVGGGDGGDRDADGGGVREGEKVAEGGGGGGGGGGPGVRLLLLPPPPGEEGRWSLLLPSGGEAGGEGQEGDLRGAGRGVQDLLLRSGRHGRLLPGLSLPPPVFSLISSISLASPSPEPPPESQRGSDRLCIL